MKAPILEWEFIHQSPYYADALLSIRTLYERDPSFKNDLHQAVDQYISKLLPADRDLTSAIKIAKEYIIEELSFLLAAQKILGQEKLCYLYHKEWPIFERLVSGEYGPMTDDELGFIQLEIKASLR